MKRRANMTFSTYTSLFGNFQSSFYIQEVTARMRTILFILSSLAIFLLSGCSSAEEAKRGCQPPNQNFSEANLIGTWWTGYVSSPKVDDYLEFRADGTYKQTIYVEYSDIPDVYYESDWLPWRIEYVDDGIPNLHLEGLRLCAHNPNMSCSQVGEGKEDWYAFNQGKWLDYCRDKMVVQENEGILLVLRAVDGNGIELAELTLTPLDTWIYRLQEPDVNTAVSQP